MSRETLKQFLANKGLSADSISYGNLSDENSSGDVDRGDDLGIDPNTGEQLIKLSEDDKGLLGDYVNYIATNYRGGNSYEIAAGNKKSNDIDRGTSIQNAEVTSGAEVFASQSTTLGDALNKYSNSGNLESAEIGLNGVIDKTGFDESLDGHTLLNIEGDELDTTGGVDNAPITDDYRHLKKVTTNMLLENNRFAPGNSGLQYSDSRTESNSKLNNKNIAKSQNSFGKNEKTGNSFIQKKLKSVGPSMLLKAAGLDIDTLNPQDFTSANVKENIPSTISARDLEAGNAYNSPVDRDSRGAFDNSSGQKMSTVHTVPGFEFQGDDSTINEKIINKFNELLSDKLAEDPKHERDDESVYTTNSYFDSVERFLDATLRNENLSNEDKAFFGTLGRGILRADAIAEVDSTKTDSRDEKIRNILDVFAALGDTDLILYKNTDGNKTKRHWDVDRLSDGPATRVSKSRSKDGNSSMSLAWRTSSMPSMYHMPMNILRSVQRTGTVSKKNPVKAMLGSSIGDKTYLAQNMQEPGDLLHNIGVAGGNLLGKDTDAKIDTSRRRIPKAVVDLMEDRLDAEYVPFYFHDLRTNEIVAFHAFLSSLNDSFVANHTAYEGYGRMDDVQIYKNTKRTISGKFILVATSKEDFDEMWFKVNKLIEMLYPQWSGGDLLSSKDSNTTFVRPFSQIPAISPMIRLRIGDVIRGNYSRFNLGRLFGSGHAETYINAESVNATTVGSLALKKLGEFFGDGDGANKVTDVANEVALQAFMLAFGSPLQLLDLIPDDDPLGGTIKKLAFDVGSQFLANGFVNPLVFAGINRLRNPDADYDEVPAGQLSQNGPVVGNPVLIRPSLGQQLHGLSDSTKPLTIDRFLKAKIDKIFKIDNKTHYNVTVIDGMSSLSGDTFVVSHEDIIVDPDYMFENYFAWFLDPINNALELVQDIVNDAASKAGISGDSVDLFTTTFEDFMSPYNNAITKSFEDSAGRGLAGFIGKLSYSLIDAKTNWEVDHGSRAPMMLEISFDFKPVHDISPGLDSDGFSRAPVYNVGSIMNNIAGDQQGEGTSSKNRYNKAANDAVKKQK